VSFLVGLGLPHGQQQAGGLGLDVVLGEGDELGAAQRGGVAEQDDRGVSGSDWGGPVDGGEFWPTSATVSGRARRRGAVP
jgi:hypothetical protein